MPEAGFNPPGEETKTCVNIVLHLPPKPPRLDLVLRKVALHFGTALSNKKAETYYFGKVGVCIIILLRDHYVWSSHIS